MIVTVKDIINFLSKYSEDTEVILDKNGWEKTGSIDSTISRLIDDSAIKYRNKNYLIINN